MSTCQYTSEIIQKRSGIADTYRNWESDPAHSIDRVTISPISAQTYTGKSLTPALEIRLDDKKLTLDADYTLIYKNNVNVGIATVVVTGKGEYAGTATVTFRIVDPSSFVDVTDKVAHADDIAWLSESGISLGWTNADGTTSFRPLANVARADMAAFLHRLDGLRH